MIRVLLLEGRNWDEDRRKRNELLAGCPDSRFAGQLKRLVREIEEFASAAKANVKHSRGVGVQVRSEAREPWPYTSPDALWKGANGKRSSAGLKKIAEE